MYHVSAQGIDERMINVHYYYYYYYYYFDCQADFDVDNIQRHKLVNFYRV